jgi:tetratricopeptide (TPR) repeat protein
MTSFSFIMKDKKKNIVSLVPYKSNSIVRVKNDIDITNRLVIELAEYFKEKGDFKRMDGDYDGAIKDFTKATELKPDFALAYYCRGSIKMELKNDSRGAIEDFTKAIELNPSDYFFYSDRGSARLGIEDYSGALEDFNKAIELNQEKFYYDFSHRGRARLGVKDYRGAIEDFNRSIELFGHGFFVHYVYFWRGNAKYAIKDYNGALEDYNKAIEKKPKYAEAYKNRSKLKQIMGDTEGANFDIEEFNKLNKF